MNDPDNFLSRWSRRKSEAGGHVERSEETEPGKPPGDDKNSLPDKKNSTPPAMEVDVSRLPPIESIGAETDISSFLQPGVPDELRRAALRRAWSADPAIREFMGLTENYWDAAGPDGVPGFGDLDPDFDVKQMISELFGERPREHTDAKTQGAQPVSSASSLETPQAGSSVGQSGQTKLPASQAQDRAQDRAQDQAQDKVSHRSENVAPQQREAEPQSAQKFVRRHGGAMPQ
jgi:hypothetical protein